MKKNLFISLGVMVLLTVIVGFTAFNLSSRWTDLSDVVTKSVAKGLFLEEIGSSIDRLVRRVDIYVLNPSPKVKNEIDSLHKDITDRLKSLKFISNKASSEELNINMIENYYRNNIYNLVLEIIATRDTQINEPAEETKAKLEKLYNHNDQIVAQINTLKDIAIPRYEQNIAQLKNYSKGVTATITLICVLLGIILMSISVNHLSTLYEQIESQAKRERIIRELTTAVCSTLDLNVIFEIATRELARALDSDKCLILEYGQDKTISVCFSYINDNSQNQIVDICDPTIVNKENPFFQEAKKTRNPIVINDVKNNINYKRELKPYKNLNILSFVIVPIILQNSRIYGFIQLENYNKPRNWPKESVDLIVDLSNQLAIAISNAQLFKNAKAKTEEASKLAKELENNLQEIKNINKELVYSNELNVKIQEDERLRVAQDLHDEIIQGLIGLVREVDHIEDNKKHDIQNDIRNLITHIRKICQNLRPSILDDLGLYSAIEWLLDDLERYGVVPHLEIAEKEEIELDEKTELVIFRIIQELTNNIKKHARATNAWLTVSYEDTNVQIQLADDGCGFEYNENLIPKTLGLIGIKERIKSVSGQLVIDTSPGDGTKVDINIPLKQAGKVKYKEEASI
jgi:signal transduction histidine kinase